jgi:HEAT repeats
MAFALPNTLHKRRSEWHFPFQIRCTNVGTNGIHPSRYITRFYTVKQEPEITHYPLPITEQIKQDWRKEELHEQFHSQVEGLALRSLGEILDDLMQQNGEPDRFLNLFLAADCLAAIPLSSRTEIADRCQQLLNALQALIRYTPQTCCALTPELELDRIHEIQTKALSAIAATWHDESDILSWLKSIVQFDSDSAIRAAAIWELVWGWLDDPDIFSLLRSRIETDDVAIVREAAIEGIARRWQGDSEVFEYLQSLAQPEQDTCVRCAALRELVLGWQDSPEVFPLLKAVALSDRDREVRRVAVQELARGWWNEPESFILLQSLAQFSEDEGVQEAAKQELARGWRVRSEPFS